MAWTLSGRHVDILVIYLLTVMRARINQTSISIDADEIRLIASKKKVYKKGSLKPRELRGMMTFHIVEGAHCQCSTYIYVLRSEVN